MDVLRSMCCWLYLQAEGGKRAGAVATVVAAVDLARVRQPVHVEGSRAEEEEVEAADTELTQRAEQQYQAAWTSTSMQAGAMLTTAQELTPERTLPQPQVREASRAKTPPVTKRFGRLSESLSRVNMSLQTQTLNESVLELIYCKHN